MRHMETMNNISNLFGAVYQIEWHAKLDQSLDTLIDNKERLAMLAAEIDRIDAEIAGGVALASLIIGHNHLCHMTLCLFFGATGSASALDFLCTVNLNSSLDSPKLSIVCT